MRLLFFSVLILALLPTALYGKYDSIPVLIRISPVQSDTLGFHFGRQIGKTIYDAILKNKIKLWDSREKETQISASSLLDIEAATKTKFSDAQQIYIYENWHISKKVINTTTLGILLSTKTASEEDVTFGYVDGKDLITLLQNTPANVNADGINGLTLAYILYMHYFDFDVMQTGHVVYNSKEQSLEARYKLIGLREFNAVLFPYPTHQKTVEYIIERSVDLKDESANKSDQLLKSIEAILKTSGLFEMLGGNKLANADRNFVNISAIKVTETWVNQSGLKKSKLDYLVIFIDNISLDTLSKQTIDQIDLKIYNNSLSSVFESKDFNYIITKINAQPIDRSQSFLFQKALLETEWNSLNKYVDQY